MDGLRQQFEAQRGRWSPAWETIAKLNPAYLEGYLKIQRAAQHRQRLPPKIQELCYIAVASSVTHIHLPAVDAHIGAALDVGATTDEIFETLGLSYLLGVHTVTLGFPILQELIEELGIKLPTEKMDNRARKEEIKDKFISQRGFWPETFKPLLDLDPEFFEQYTTFRPFLRGRRSLSPNTGKSLFAPLTLRQHIYMIEAQRFTCEMRCS